MRGFVEPRAGAQRRRHRATLGVLNEHVGAQHAQVLAQLHRQIGEISVRRQPGHIGPDKPGQAFARIGQEEVLLDAKAHQPDQSQQGDQTAQVKQNDQAAKG